MNVYLDTQITLNIFCKQKYKNNITQKKIYKSVENNKINF